MSPALVRFGKWSVLVPLIVLIAISASVLSAVGAAEEPNIERVTAHMQAQSPQPELYLYTFATGQCLVPTACTTTEGWNGFFYEVCVDEYVKQNGCNTIAVPLEEAARAASAAVEAALEPELTNSLQETSDGLVWITGTNDSAPAWGLAIIASEQPQWSTPTQFAAFNPGADVPPPGTEFLSPLFLTTAALPPGMTQPVCFRGGAGTIWRWMTPAELAARGLPGAAPRWVEYETFSLRLTPTEEFNMRCMSTTWGDGGGTFALVR